MVKKSGAVGTVLISNEAPESSGDGDSDPRYRVQKGIVSILALVSLFALVCVLEIGIVGHSESLSRKIEFSRNADCALIPNFINTLNFSAKINQAYKPWIRDECLCAPVQMGESFTHFGIKIERNVFPITRFQDGFAGYFDVLFTRFWIWIDGLASLKFDMRLYFVKHNDVGAFDCCLSSSRIENRRVNFPFWSRRIVTRIQGHLSNDDPRSELKNQTSVHQVGLARNVAQRLNSSPDTTDSYENEYDRWQVCGSKKAAEIAIRFACGCYCLLLGCTLIWRQPEDTAIRSRLCRILGPTLVGLGLAMFLFPPYYVGDCENHQGHPPPRFEQFHSVATLLYVVSK